MRPHHDTGPSGPSVRPPRSTCKICWHSIYVHQETDWVVSPNPGLAHQDCAQKRRAESSPRSYSLS